MMWRTHQVGGVATGLLMTSVMIRKGMPYISTNYTWAIPIVIGAWLGGLFPDLDHPKSKLANVSILGIKPLLPIALLFSSVFGHRKMTHTLYFLLLTTAPFIFSIHLFPNWSQLTHYISTYIGIGFAGGYLSHLLLDSLTSHGVAILPPLPKLKIIGMTTNGAGEGVVFVLLVIMGIWSVLYGLGVI